MRGNSFSLNPTLAEQVVFSIKENVVELWHKRLEHYHYQGLLKLQKCEMVRDLLDFEVISTNCRACQYGTQSRLPFPTTTWRAKKKS